MPGWRDPEAHNATSPSSTLHTVLLWVLAFHNPRCVVVSGRSRRHSGRCFNALSQSLYLSSFRLPRRNAIASDARCRHSPNTVAPSTWSVQSPKASFPMHSLLIIHLDKGSLVPPCTHMAGPRSPGLLYYLYKVVGYFVLHSRSSFLAPDPHSSFSLSFLVQDPRSSFWM